MNRHSNLGAERAILGAALLDNNTLPEIAETITSGDFYSSDHRQIFNAMQELQSFDLLTLGEKLRVDHRVDNLNVLYDLSEPLTTAGVTKYCKIVHDLSIKRKHINDMTIMIEDLNEGESLESLYDFYNSLIISLNGNTTVGWTRLGAGYKGIYDRITDAIEGKEIYGVPTGFTKLDKLTGGAKPGELWVIGACSSHGKTTMATQVAINAAENGLAVGFFSFEMNRETLLMYHASRIAGLDYNDVVNGNITQRENVKFAEEMHRLSKLNIEVYESAMLTPDQLVSAGTRKDFDLILIDYLQRFAQRKNQQLREAIGNGAKASKTLAKEQNCPVFLVSSLTKEVSKRDPEITGKPGTQGLRGIPKISDLKESGDIEYEADNVLLLTIPHKCNNPVDLTDGWWILAKQRTGKTAVMQMQWDKNQWSNR